MEEHEDLFNLDEINTVIEDQFRDKTRKEIGDRVAVIDYSSVTREDGSDIDEEDEDMQFNPDMYFIVSDTNQKVVHCLTHSIELKFTQDLVIANPQTKMQYRVSSGHVQLY